MNKSILNYGRIVAFLSLALVFTACGSGFVSRDMVLNTSSSNGANSSDEDSDGTGEIVPEEPAPASIPVAAAFKYILPGGVIDPSCPVELANTLQSLYASSGKHSPDFYTSNAYKITVVEAGNLTKSQIASGNSWSLYDAAKGEYTYYKGGEQFTIFADVETTGKDITYHQYRSLNPFFSPFGSYNSRSFTSVDGSQETIMKRFQFYRWSGFASGQGVSNYMIAIDTYTGLVFQFAEIDEWATILGIDAPSKYAPFESFDGRRNFYEYDPIGYVDSNGLIVTNEWYKDEVSKPFAESKTTTPGFGKSPYYYEEGKTESIDAIVEEQDGYPASGTMTVRAKSLKNVNVGVLTTIIPEDEALGGSTLELSQPQYTYTIGATAFSGTVTEKDIVALTSATNKEIKENNTHTFSTNTKSFDFTNSTDMLTLELSADITRVSQNVNHISKLGSFPIGWITGIVAAIWQSEVVPASSVTSIDIPTAFLYNREKLQWEDGKGFTLKDGEKKDYTIEYMYGDGIVQLTYELSWSREVSSSDTGNVIIPTLDKNIQIVDNNLSVSGGSNLYTVYYVDQTIESASESKDIVLDLALLNLDTDVEPIVLSYTSVGETLFEKIRLENGFIIKRGGSFGTESIPVNITLSAFPWATQEGLVTIKLVYPKEGYDSEYSPKEVAVKIIREHRFEE